MESAQGLGGEVIITPLGVWELGSQGQGLGLACNGAHIRWDIEEICLVASVIEHRGALVLKGTGEGTGEGGVKAQVKGG